MSELLKRANQFKEEAERKRRQADKAQGALDSLLAQLKKDYDLDSLEELDKRIPQLQKQLKSIQQELTQSLDEYNQKWGDKI